jgi:citronellol/citronellal dehydrogenase
MKKYDLSHEASLRGTFMVSKICLPYLIESGKAGRNP